MQRSITQFAGLPTASGGLSRLAVNRVRRAGIRVEPLLSRAGLTIDQVDDPEKRIDAGKQIAFLAVAADVLNDDFLDLSLAEEFDCRDLGLLYYVMASSDTPCSASPVTAASPMKLSCFSTEKRPSLRSA
jgi:hypothetical protein